MSLFLSVHALKRMAARGIGRSEIQEIIAAPETTYPSAEDAGRTVLLGTTAEGRRLKVVVESHDTESVITVADRDSET